MQTKISTINIVKVENGYVVQVQKKAYIAEDEQEVRDILTGSLPDIIAELDKPEEPKDARPEPEIPSSGRAGIDNQNVEKSQPATA
jgi:hypothetical protein